MTACIHHSFPVPMTGAIAPDTYSPGRDPGPLWFCKSYLHGPKDFGIKEGDNVSFLYQTVRRMRRGGFMPIANDIRVIDNG